MNASTKVTMWDSKMRTRLYAFWDRGIFEDADILAADPALKKFASSLPGLGVAQCETFAAWCGENSGVANDYRSNPQPAEAPSEDTETESSRAPAFLRAAAPDEEDDWLIRQQLRTEKAMNTLMKSSAMTRALRQVRNSRTTPAADRGSRQRGEQTRSQAKSGDSNSDDGSDPDPADQIIPDKWSFINPHKASEPINRILRKAILAHRAGLQDTNLRVYNWHLDRALGEIRRAMHGLVTQWDGAHSYAHSLVSACAVRLFYHVCLPPKPKGAPKTVSGGHDFNQRPNPVATDLVTHSAFRNVDDLRDYARTGMYQDNLKSDREDFEGKVFEETMDARVQVDLEMWNPSPKAAIEPSAEFFGGVKIKHLDACVTVDNPKAAKGEQHTYSVRAVAARAIGYPVTGFATEKDFIQREEEGRDDRIDMLRHLRVDPTEDREALEVAQAGTQARQIVHYILTQPGRETAIRDVADLLVRAGDERVLAALSRDKANAGLVAEILGLVGYEYAPVPDPDAEEEAKLGLEDELEVIALQPDDLLYHMRVAILDRLRVRHRFANSGNLRSKLKTRAENRFGRFSPEVQRVASLLLGGAV